MKKTSAIIFAVLLIIAGQALSEELPFDVEVVPPNPTSHDVVYITASGEWDDSCVPNRSAVRLEGNNIYFDVIWDYDWGVICATVISGWELTESVGPLPAGTYTVYACLTGYFWPLPYKKMVEFDVTATTYYVDAVDGNDNNDGLSPETAFATIQKGIDVALNGDTVIALPGVYNERINFLGKNITVRSTDPTDPSIVRATTIAWGVNFQGTEDASCSLTGFNIVNGGICGGQNHTHACISYCQLNGRWCCWSAIEFCDGKISNCLIGRNYGICLELCMPPPVVNGCHGLIRNCTIANHAFGVWVLDGGTTTIENCIIYGNRGYQLGVGSGGVVNVLYSDVQGGMGGISGGGIVNWGPGNIDVEPFFADANNCDYHLKSQAGRWDENSQSWVQDWITSACIDAGNPGCPVGNEPMPNGNRTNMGAYGGTVQASKSPPGWRSIADMDNDFDVDFGDLGVFVNWWLDQGMCIPSDLDRSRRVDFADFAIFGEEWPSDELGEPGMTYQIGGCGQGAGDMPASADSNEPRFTVWVEGSYIHFEDTMYANCCPDELGLEKEINGNQITLYEIGYGGMCDCMCYFPITATLGPFEDGTFTVEVFDNSGQSLGVVEVTIGQLPEPSIIYQIDDCDSGVSGLSTEGQSEQTRFSVTVEGSYIHFKDTMVANCCPDELEVQMTVEDNLITINEIEYLSMPCTCICPYPVTATLGPFEPGTYTLEVYEDYGGFIGSTTVTIE